MRYRSAACLIDLIDFGTVMVLFVREVLARSGEASQPIAPMTDLNKVNDAF